MRVNYWLSSLAIVVLTLIVPVQAVRANGTDGDGGSAQNSVVKVFTTQRAPDPYHPWSRQSSQEITGTGVVIEGHRILTNAHVVLYAGQVQIQANQAGDKISAHVEAIAPGIDLAVLKLDDDSFFATHPPLARASKMPNIKDVVWAYGFPTGGDSLSITKGIVSRIEFVSYNYPTSGLRIQIDAAINPGNSGGPAVVNDQMIGLAFSHLGNAQNIGYIIPNEEIELFLQSIDHGVYTAKPTLIDSLQNFENAGLRTYLHLSANVKGAIVDEPAKSTPDYPLKKWDVITHIGSTPVDDEGMVNLGNDLRVSFRYLVQKTANHGVVPLTIVRGGKTLSVNVPVVVDRPMLIRSLDGAYPSYFIYGPLVFSRATREFLGAIDSNGTVAATFSLLKSPLVTQRGDAPTAEREELVVISSPPFPHPLSKGYSSMAGFVVKSINGTPVRSLKHLVSLLRDSKDEYIVIEFDGREAETQVYRRQDMVDATEEILNDNSVRAQASPDMLSVWQAGNGAK